MKNNQPVTQQERHFPEGVPLVSTTDVKGQITFVNDAFVDICGFTRDELIGQSHNIVRHPDVPPAAFGDLWGTLKKGKPWMGVVKNRTKNGDFYWVNAFVTPIVENGSVVGYQSVRVKPKKSQVNRAESIYKRVNAGQSRINRFDLPVSKVLPALMPIAVFLPVLLSYFLELDRNIALAVSLSVGIAIALLSLWFMKPLTLAAKRLSRDSDNALLAEMYTGFSAEVGRLEHSSLMKKANEDAIRARIQFSAKELNELGDETHEIAEQAATAVNQQGYEVQHISAAISQMAAAIDEVACQSRNALEATSNALNHAQQGQSVVSDSRLAINHLSDQVSSASDQVEELYQASQSINHTVTLINEIAAQTNLLALNAAIEAARAGEQGRGFAVVADEVRSLAERTQESTGQIQETLTRLGRETEQVLQVMRTSRERADASVAQAEIAGETLGQIANHMDRISDMNSSIARAATEQSAAAEEIRSNLSGVNEATETAMHAAEQTRDASADLIRNVKVIMQSIAQ